MKKTRKPYPADFKTTFAFSTMMWPVSAGTVLITSFFMQYLTDYSGIDQALGKAGFAAAMGTILLLVARIVDIVDDPLQAYIIDNAKEGKLGKYRKFAFLNIFLVTIATVCIFAIPGFIKTNAVLICAWVGFFYLLYELGLAFNTTMPLMQKVSYDTALRTKWTKLMRLWIIVIMIPVNFFIPIVTAVDAGVGNLGQSFSLVSILLMLVVSIVAFIGVRWLKEPRSRTQAGADEKLKLREILSMFAKNKPLIVQTIAMLFSNMVYALSSAVSVYFLKWYYAADLTTGVVDAALYAAVFGAYSIAGLLPNFIGPFVAGKFIKKFRTYSRATGVLMLVAVFLYAVQTLMFYTGILKISPYVFVVFSFLSGLVLGTAVVPQTLLWTESADYAEWKTGKKMSALINSINNMMGKAQSALSGVLIGAVLIGVGYSVDSISGNYSGDISKLPDMISGFGMFITIIPVVVLLLSWVLYKFFYPITPEIQEEMVEALQARREETQ